MQKQKSRRILVVDDEEAIIFAFQRTFTNSGFDVDVAENLPDAKSLIDLHSYQVVIADLRLSDSTQMEGFEVVQYARKNQPKVKIIVITAYGDNQTRDHVFKLGADIYLEKPTTPKKVRKILASIGIIDQSGI